MGGVNNLPVAELFEIQVKIQLVAIYALLNFTDKSFFAQKPLGLAQCAIP